MKQQQYGGTILGFILGLIVGLGAALGVAMYVTKVPVPFLNKETTLRDYENSEAERNRNWDPNSPLYGKGAVQPSPQQPATASAPPPSTDTGANATASAETAPAAMTSPADDAKPDNANTAEAPSRSPAPTGDGFNYFVQAGAFRVPGDADSQRAKLAMQGWEARISEREQSGRLIYRVRLGPFSQRSEAEELKQKLDSAGIDSSLVRVYQ